MIADFFNSTAVVSRVTNPITGMGGPKKTYTTRIASLACRLSNKGIQERDERGKMTIRERDRLYCDASSTNKAMAESDKVVVEGKTFMVTGIENPGFLDRHLEIDLEEVR